MGSNKEVAEVIKKNTGIAIDPNSILWFLAEQVDVNSEEGILYGYPCPYSGLYEIPIPGMEKSTFVDVDFRLNKEVPLMRELLIFKTKKEALVGLSEFERSKKVNHDPITIIQQTDKQLEKIHEKLFDFNSDIKQSSSIPSDTKERLFGRIDEITTMLKREM